MKASTRKTRCLRQPQDTIAVQSDCSLRCKYSYWSVRTTLSLIILLQLFLPHFRGLFFVFFVCLFLDRSRVFLTEVESDSSLTAATHAKTTGSVGRPSQVNLLTVVEFGPLHIKPANGAASGHLSQSQWPFTCSKKKSHFFHDQKWSL